MAKFTFLEIHFDDAEFTASATAPFGPGDKTVEASDDPPEPEDRSRTAPIVGAVVGLVFLVVVAYVAKRRFLGEADSGDDGELEAFDEEFDAAA